MKPAAPLLLFACLAVSAEGKSSTYHARRPAPIKAPKVRLPKTPKPTKVQSSSTVHRDPKQKAAFEKTHPCPSTGKTSGGCPGYVVDHVRPLACGGADAPSNMQWQTEAAGKIKDTYERNGCK